MGASSNTTDSNIVGLAIAEEVLGTPGTLPGTPIWYSLEPNSYSNFGGMVKTTKRETINSTRQKRKGLVTALDVAAGFQIDFTTRALYPLMRGFMFAAWREKDNLTVTSTTATTTYNVASGGAAFTATDLLFAENFTNASNNGLKNITSSTGTTVVPTTALVNETAPSNALITRVGFQGASGDIGMTVTSGVPTLTSTVLDFTTKGLIPGEWVWVGGDGAAFNFATAPNAGFYRIRTVAAHALTFDRYPAGAVATDAGTGKTVQVFLGHVIKNEYLQSLQTFHTFTIERQLTSAKVQLEHGMGANTLSVNVTPGNKVELDLAFVGLTETTATSASTGTRVPVLPEAAFTGATSFTRLRLSNDTAGAALETYVTNLKLSIENQIVPDFAISNSIGAIDLTAGDFMVAGTVEAYFSNLSDITALQTNADCGIDFGMVENVTTPNVGTAAQGWLFDVPLLMLGDGRLKVEKDKPVMLPVSLDAAAHTVLNHTLMALRYAYLPQAAL